MIWMEKGRKLLVSKLFSLTSVLIFLTITVILIISTYFALGTFGADYSFGFFILVSYTTFGMGAFTFLRIWILRNKGTELRELVIQLGFVWVMSIMYIAVGVSFPAHYSILSTFNPTAALIIAVVAATDFWVIENTTKTTVDLLTNPELRLLSKDAPKKEEAEQIFDN